jgi:hypothetical protein
MLVVPAMRAVAVITLIAAAAPAARADDRGPTVAVSAFGGLLQRADHPGDGTDVPPMFGGRVLVAFEHDPVPYPGEPGEPGAAARLELVPELFVGTFVERNASELFAGAGVRLDLKYAQRELGLLRVTARGGLYLAARGLIVGEHRDPFVETTLGTYVMVRDTKVGFEFGFLWGPGERYDPATARDVHDLGGIIALVIGR